VLTNGPKHTHLTYRYAGVTKSYVYRFTRDNKELLIGWRDLGFTKFTITDGYSNAWELDLTRHTGESVPRIGSQ
jgi:hypothetical protein